METLQIEGASRRALKDLVDHYVKSQEDENLRVNQIKEVTDQQYAKLGAHDTQIGLVLKQLQELPVQNRKIFQESMNRDTLEKKVES